MFNCSVLINLKKDKKEKKDKDEEKTKQEITEKLKNEYIEIKILPELHFNEHKENTYFILHEKILSALK